MIARKNSDFSIDAFFSSNDVNMLPKKPLLGELAVMADESRLHSLETLYLELNNADAKNGEVVKYLGYAGIFYINMLSDLYIMLQKKGKASFYYSPDLNEIRLLDLNRNKG